MLRIMAIDIDGIYFFYLLHELAHKLFKDLKGQWLQGKTFLAQYSGIPQKFSAVISPASYCCLTKKLVQSWQPKQQTHHGKLSA